MMLPVCKVVFMEVHEPRGHVARHSLEDQRVWRVQVGDSTAVQVAFQVALRGTQERLMNNRKKNNIDAFLGVFLRLQMRWATYVSHQRAKLHDQQIGSDLWALRQALYESRVLEGSRRGDRIQRLAKHADLQHLVNRPIEFWWAVRKWWSPAHWTKKNLQNLNDSGSWKSFEPTKNPLNEQASYWMFDLVV